MASAADITDIDLIPRPCDGKDCIVCGGKIFPSDEGCFLTVPSKKLKRIKKEKLATFVFKWNIAEPFNALHSRCWDRRKSVLAAEDKLISSVEETLERFCTNSKLREQALLVRDLMEDSRSTVCFTGAGISTSAGISDYRGSGGLDNLAAHGDESVGASEAVADDADEEDINYTKLEPTFAHKAIAELNRHGKINYVITQNCDNLHQKAGLSSSSISDLHGNVFIEYCEKCFMQYERDYCVDAYSTDCHEEPWYVKCPTCSWNHYTGRKCDSGSCKGKLRDTIVNFGDDLHTSVCGGMLKARRNSRHADVCLAVGTSLSVTPANQLPLMAKKLVIVNLQATDLDDKATVRIYATSDQFFHVLMDVIV